MEEKERRFEEAIKYLVEEGLIDGKDIVKDIGKKTGYTPNVIREVRRGKKRSFTQKFIKKFCMVFGDIISPQWLLSGEGNMLNQDAFTPTMTRLPSDFDKITRPRFPVSATAGNLQEYLDGVHSYDCDNEPIIRDLPDYDFTIIVQGNSMEPAFIGGDEIACKKVDSVIHWGRPHLVETKRDGVVLKRVYDDGESIRCVSDNHAEYPDYCIPKSDINALYQIVGLLRARPL